MQFFNAHYKMLDLSSVVMMEATALQMWWSSSNGGRNTFKWRPQLFCIVQSMPTLLQLYLHVGNGVNLQLYVLYQQSPVIILQRTRRIKRTRRINLIHHQKNDLLCITFSLQATIYWEPQIATAFLQVSQDRYQRRNQRSLHKKKSVRTVRSLHKEISQNALVYQSRVCAFPKHHLQRMMQSSSRRQLAQRSMYAVFSMQVLKIVLPPRVLTIFQHSKHYISFSNTISSPRSLTIVMTIVLLSTTNLFNSHKYYFILSWIW